MHKQEQHKAIKRHDDIADQVAGLGRWWLERDGGLVLSTVAAGFFGVDPHAGAEACLASVEPEDQAILRNTLDRIATSAGLAECEFRVRREGQGVSWLRLQSVTFPAGGAAVSGILVDITAIKHAAARERFNAALTQYLVGIDDIDDAVTRILQLVCEELGWEWGAFWAFEQHEAQPGQPSGSLRCRYVWHAPRSALAPFVRASANLRLRPGQGLLGKI